MLVQTTCRGLKMEVEVDFEPAQPQTEHSPGVPRSVMICGVEVWEGQDVLEILDEEFVKELEAQLLREYKERIHG